MLTIFRRHRIACPGSKRAAPRRYRACKCPIYVEGSLAGQFIKKALDQTSWEAASSVVAEWTQAGEIGKKARKLATVSEAIDAYLEDAQARHLKAATLSKLATIFRKGLLAFAEHKGFRYLKQLDVSALSEWRASWKDAALAASKKYERVVGFFYFCIRRGYLDRNPMKELRPPKVAGTIVLPFEPAQVEAIIRACDAYPAKGIYGAGNRTRLRAFVLLLRYSGLRIGDVVGLRRDAIKDGRILVHAKKNQAPVRLPLPEHLLRALEEVTPVSEQYWFYSGNGHLKSAVADWQRSLRRLFTLAGVSGYPHRFRHTLATELLSQGVSVEIVAAILGHSPRITLKHYAPWVQSRQAQLEESIKSVWEATAS